MVDIRVLICTMILGGMSWYGILNTDWIKWVVVGLIAILAASSIYDKVTK